MSLGKCHFEIWWIWPKFRAEKLQKNNAQGFLKEKKALKDKKRKQTAINLEQVYFCDAQGFALLSTVELFHAKPAFGNR